MDDIDKQIASGEISVEEAERRLLAAGVPRLVARLRISVLRGERKDEPLPDPSTLPSGLGL